MESVPCPIAGARVMATGMLPAKGFQMQHGRPHGEVESTDGTRKFVLNIV